SRRMPALLMTMSTRPKASSAVLTMASAPSGEATLLPSATAAPPRASISSTTFWAGPADAPVPSTAPPRSLTTTWAPRDASRRACSRPSPPPAPVMTATLPSKPTSDMQSSSRPALYLPSARIRGGDGPVTNNPALGWGETAPKATATTVDGRERSPAGQREPPSRGHPRRRPGAVPEAGVPLGRRGRHRHRRRHLRARRLPPLPGQELPAGGPVRLDHRAHAARRRGDPEDRLPAGRDARPPGRLPRRHRGGGEGPVGRVAAGLAQPARPGRAA